MKQAKGVGQRKNTVYQIKNSPSATPSIQVDKKKTKTKTKTRERGNKNEKEHQDPYFAQAMCNGPRPYYSGLWFTRQNLTKATPGSQNLVII